MNDWTSLEIKICNSNSKDLIEEHQRAFDFVEWTHNNYTQIGQLWIENFADRKEQKNYIDSKKLHSLFLEQR